MEGRHFMMADEDSERTWPKDGDSLSAGGRIGAKLRALYAEIEREPIPGQLLDLLEQLDDVERRQSR